MQNFFVVVLCFEYCTVVRVLCYYIINKVLWSPPSCMIGFLCVFSCIDHKIVCLGFGLIIQIIIGVASFVRAHVQTYEHGPHSCTSIRHKNAENLLPFLVLTAA
jgi:nicotinamide riboside transporter PnuC